MKEDKDLLSASIRGAMETPNPELGSLQKQAEAETIQKGNTHTVPADTSTTKNLLNGQNIEEP